MECPQCKKPMVRLFVNLTTGEELWKCRICGHTEKVMPKEDKELIPSWISRSREQVADEEEIGASFHYTVLNYIKEHPEEKDQIMTKYGDEEWHHHWMSSHLEAAWYVRHPQSKFPGQRL